MELLGHLRSVAMSDRLEIPLSQSTSLREALMMLPERLRGLVFSKGGEFQAGLLILVNGADVRSLRGGEVVVDDSDVVTIIPAIHGGVF
ncbi:MAG: MoaD/ThiS family protein [Nitrososphaerota archaeon]